MASRLVHGCLLVHGFMVGAWLSAWLHGFMVGAWLSAWLHGFMVGA
jgi:hypothetical protein